jgi:pimeloyl-ACP methyl ester carboxylesterase
MAAPADDANTLATATTAPTTQPAASKDAAIRPFRVEVPQAALDDLRRRVLATHWPDKETVADQSQGAQLAKLQELVRYWGTGYDWRKVEARLNALPQFTTTIDGVEIHFIQVRSRHPNALPVIVTHGWPGSVIEQLKIIGPLTDPTAHGGSAQDAFDVVIPSLPGYAFSGKPSGTGWDPEHIGRAWAELMKRLGYTRYVAQGGDWGTAISSAMARQGAPGLLGIHINLPATIPPEVGAALGSGGPAPAGLSDKERAVFDSLIAYNKKGYAAYFTMLTARPQTIGYGTADSPAFLAAWMLVHPGFTQWTFGNDPQQSPTKDDVLDNVTLYWLTNSGNRQGGCTGRTARAAASSVRRRRPPDLAASRHHRIPGGRLSPSETGPRAYRNLSYFHEVVGRDFAAWNSRNSSRPSCAPRSGCSVEMPVVVSRSRRDNTTSFPPRSTASAARLITSIPS